MDLTYHCKLCGRSSEWSLDVLSSGAKLVCPYCGRVSSQGETAQKSESSQTELNAEQRQAAEYDGDARGILVLAGAGCGKTRTMIARAVHLLNTEHIPPRRLAMLTFTRRAAREILERLERESPDAASGVFVGTLHRFCLTLMHRYGFGIDNDGQILDKDDEHAILKRLRASLVSERYGSVRDLQGVVPKEAGIAAVFSYISNCRISLEEYYEKHPSDSSDTLPLMRTTLENYNAYKEEKHCLDFDDILLKTAEALETSEQLRKRICGAYDYILVDEMQDTSPVQWDILRAVYPQIRLFCVGDDAQSIYSFRGADFTSIHNFCTMLPQSITLKLTKNYRSTQKILDTANMVLADSPLKYGKHLVAVRKEEGDKPLLHDFSYESEEARHVCRVIAEQLRKGCPAKEILVLMRTVSSGRHLEAELKSWGIPYRLFGGMNFLQASHVKDIVSTLEALENPFNDLAWLRTLKLCKGIGNASAERIIRKIPQNASPADARALVAKELERKAPATSAFLQSISDEEQLPYPLLQQILNYYDETGVMALHYDDWKERKRDLESVLDISRKYASVPAFLEAFKLDPDEERRDLSKAPENKITLATIHSAKGLEARVCILLRFQAGVFPHYLSSGSEEQMEEERRILYVALTRAKDTLLITRADCNYQGISASPFMTLDVLDTIDYV